MTSRLPVVFVSTYPPEHCGVGKSAFDLVQEVRRNRPITVVANVVLGAPPPPAGVIAAWRKRSFWFPFEAASAARKPYPPSRAIAQVNHHFFLYGGPLSNLEFPFLLLLLRLAGFRVAVELHSVIDPEQLGANREGPYHELPAPLVRLGLRAFYRTVAMLADIVFAPGASSSRLLVSSYGLPADRVVAVSPGWDLQLIPGASSGGTKDLRRFTVVFHGFLDPSKGLEILLDSFRGLLNRVPNAQLIIVGEPAPELRGDGEAYLAELRLRVERLGIEERVQFTGYMSEADLFAVLRSASAIALPYTMTLSLGGSAVLTRVAALGTPIVASRISRFSDELVDGRDALLVPPGDPSALEAALVRLATDPELAERLGHELQSAAASRGWAATARTMEREIYSRLDSLRVQSA
ncbi:MAG: glycosyltransferase [Thermoplasmata archaeon]|nr:glycosyltransferase [Thermoplasmata archaeon]